MLAPSTIRPAQWTNPKLPSHQITVGGNSLVLLRGDEGTVIADAEVHSMRWQTFAFCPAYHAQRRQPKVGYHLMTVIHGAEKIETKVRLPWKAGQLDRLDEYRFRVAGSIAQRVLRQIREGRHAEGSGWRIEQGWLHLETGEHVELDRVTDIRYYGEEAAVWTLDDPNPLSLASDRPDQLILTVLLQHYADNRKHELATAEPLGKRLFELRGDRRLALKQLAHRLFHSPETPIVFATGILAIFFLVTTFAGDGRLPSLDDWKRAGLLPLPFMALFLIAASRSISAFLAGLVGQALRWRSIAVHERGLILHGWVPRSVPYERITDFRLKSQAIYRSGKFVHSQADLHLAITAGGERVVCRHFHWFMPTVARGELAFLNDLLDVATERRD